MTERTITSVEVNDRRVFNAGRGAGPACGGLVNVAYGHYNFAKGSETVSATLVVALVALPDQSRILDLWYRTTGFGGTGGFVIGDASLSSRFMSGSLSAVPQFGRMISNGAVPPAGINYKVSLTASDVNSFYTVNFTINGAPTATASGCIAMTVYYTLDVAAT